MTKRLWITATLVIGCGDNAGTTPDAADPPPPPPTDAMGPPVLTCGNPDGDAPVVWAMSPLDKAIGVDEANPITFDVADGCGVDMASIALTIGGVPLTPTITGDSKNLRVQYTPPAGFAQDSIVAAQLVTRDAAGNTTTTPLTFRIWDDYTVHLRAVAGIDSTTPTTSLGAREYYRVDAAPATAARMLGRLAFSFDTGTAGIVFVTARMHACSRPVAEPRTIEAFRLRAEFDHTTTTWMKRTASAAWSSSGADAVPADRDAAPFAALTFQPTTDYWSRAASGDLAPTLQAWYDDAAQNYGFVLAGAPGNVEINNGNCPLQVKGFLGRPLP